MIHVNRGQRATNINQCSPLTWIYFPQALAEGEKNSKWKKQKTRIMACNPGFPGTPVLSCWNFVTATGKHKVLTPAQCRKNAEMLCRHVHLACTACRTCRPTPCWQPNFHDCVNSNTHDFISVLFSGVEQDCSACTHWHFPDILQSSSCHYPPASLSMWAGSGDCYAPPPYPPPTGLL